MRHTLSNRTNRTIECPLPGKRWIRLLPGEHCDLTDAQAATPRVSQLLRRSGVVLRRAADKAADTTTGKPTEKEDPTPAPAKGAVAGLLGELEARRPAHEVDAPATTKKPEGGTNDNG